MKKYKDNELTKFVAPSEFYANEYSKLTDCSVNFIPHAIDVTRLETIKTKKEINAQYNMERFENAYINVIK